MTNSVLITLLLSVSVLTMIGSLVLEPLVTVADAGYYLETACCHNNVTTAFMGPVKGFTGSYSSQTGVILLPWSSYSVPCSSFFGGFMPPITELDRGEIANGGVGTTVPGFIGLEYRSYGESPYYYVMAGRYKDYLYDGYPFGSMDGWWEANKTTNGKVAVTSEGKYRIVNQTDRLPVHYCGNVLCTDLEDCFSRGLNVQGIYETGTCRCGGCAPGFNGTNCNEFSIGGDNFTLLNLTNGSTSDEVRIACQSVPGRDMFSIARDKQQWDELQAALTPSHRYFINIGDNVTRSQWVARGGRFDTKTVSEGSTIIRGYAEWAPGEGADTTRGSCADMSEGKIYQSKCKGHRYGICVSLSCALVDCGDTANFVSGVFPNCFCNCTDGTSGAQASGGDGRCKSNSTASSISPSKVPLGMGTGVFVGVTVVTAIGGFGTLTDSASSLQLAAMLSNMSCSTIETTNQALEYLLSPIKVADTKANKLIGSFVLVAAITLVYAMMAAAVLTIVRRVGDQDGDAPEQRVSRVKGFILFPHFPVVVSVLFFPGVVFESGSLLYGNKTGGSWYGVLLGVIGMMLSLLLVGYHVAVGILATRRISAAASIATNSTGKDFSSNYDKEERDAVMSVDAGNCMLRSPEEENAVMNQDHASSPIASNNGDHGDGDLCIPTTDPNEVPISPRSDGETPNPDGDGSIYAPITKAVPEATELSPQQDDSIIIESPTKQRNDDIDNISQNSFVSHDDELVTPSTSESRWFVRYSDTQRGYLPTFLATIVLAEGYYGPAAQQSAYAAITGISLHCLAVMCAHNVVQVFLVSIVAAVDGSDRSDCNVIQGVIAAICFIHAILIIALRCYRVPILNVLQFVQNIVLGLLACSGFIQDATAQAAFSITMIVITLITCILMLVIAFLEWRLRASVSNNEQSSSIPPSKKISLSNNATDNEAELK